MTFSQRKGLIPFKTEIQRESIDTDLLNSLWSLLKQYYWDTVGDPNDKYNISYSEKRELVYAKTFFDRLWLNHFKWALDTLDYYWPVLYKKIRDIFFRLSWNEVYDFIEFVVIAYPNSHINELFKNKCNVFLERELSAYRFVDNMIIEITSKDEIDAIENAIVISDKFKPVQEHLLAALALYSNKKSPDYRNSIKESISALESLGKILTGNDKVMLPDALRELERIHPLHSALKEAYIKLYAYTSDSNGIRHGLQELPDLDSADAKYMLVICSAFINYLISKMKI